MRNQISSSKQEKRSQQVTEYAPILDKIGGQTTVQKIDKSEYRNELQRQIEERKAQIKKEEMIKKQEDMKYYQHLQKNYHLPLNQPEADYSYDINNSNVPTPQNKGFVRQSTITSQKSETPQSIAKKMQYQAELRAQIEERERQKKAEEQRLKDLEEYEEKKKLEEQQQLNMQYQNEMGSQGNSQNQSNIKNVDVSNRNKYFEPSSNNPIPSVGIKKVAQNKFSGFNQPTHINESPPNAYHEPSPINQSLQNPSAFHKPPISGPQFPQNESNFGSDIPQMPIYAVQSQMQIPPPIQQPPHFNNQLKPTIQEGQSNELNSVIENQKHLIQMYQDTLKQMMEFQVNQSVNQLKQQQIQQEMQQRESQDINYVSNLYHEFL